MHGNGFYLSSHISHHPEVNGILERWDVQWKPQLRCQLGANTFQGLEYCVGVLSSMIQYVCWINSKCMGVISSLSRLDRSNTQAMGVRLAPLTFEYCLWNLHYLCNLNFCFIRGPGSLGIKTFTRNKENSIVSILLVLHAIRPAGKEQNNYKDGRV